MTDTQQTPDTAAPKAMDPSEFMIRLTALKAYEAKAAEMRKELEKNAPAELETAEAILPDGTPAGTVTYRPGYAKAKVTDLTKLTDYVGQHHPEQIIMSVEPSFIRHLLGIALHEEIPGTEVTTVKESHSVRLTSDAYEMIWLHRAENPEFARLIDLP